ncbi:hypothetical protein HXX76_005189 [Chlamydomonas incerta]|uniref:Protein kinase domain-containing protein n=1 Tax=Chlamydomonas incerta TaxID=51695 RepID=A0A835W2Y5_CHLIN|nr:hypothetical protein HXX76_005189 [Chlamydomonas incerta]|eukprot:KAG2438642.1 hypothetical protein HXX76_005189 [Chlamydomonas incerta]
MAWKRAPDSESGNTTARARNECSTAGFVQTTQQATASQFSDVENLVNLQRSPTSKAELAFDGSSTWPRTRTFDDIRASISNAYWVGQGASGAVVRAQWRSEGCTCAIKWIVCDAPNAPAAYMEALVAKMLAHPYLVQTFEYGLCQLDASFQDLRRTHALGSIFGLSDLCAPSPPQQAGAAGTSLGATSRSNIAGVETGAASTAYSEEQFSVLATPDSFDGPNAPEPQLPTRPVDCVDVLRQLGAAPGKYVVQIVSEWCDEGTLHAAIRKGVFKAQPQNRRSRTWALRALLRTAREVALGMCHLHSLNIIHGDLKPGNVLLKSSRVDSRGFVAKVADFGLSRLLTVTTGDSEGQFVPTSEWATVAYMAGEYLDNRLCKSSDVYSFGVLLWQMFTGKAPFAGHHEAQVAVGVMTGSLHLEWPTNMPPPLARLGQACCRHEPEQRPTFKECVVALAGIEAQVREATANAKQRFATISASASQRGMGLLAASSGAPFGPSTMPTAASALDMSAGAAGGAPGPSSSAAVFGAGAGAVHVGYGGSSSSGWLQYPSGFTSIGGALYPYPYPYVPTATPFISAAWDAAGVAAAAGAAAAGSGPAHAHAQGAAQHPPAYTPYLHPHPYNPATSSHHAPQQQQVPLRTCFSMEQPSHMSYGGAGGGSAAAAASSTMGGALDSAAAAEPPLFMSLAHSAVNLHMATSASRSTLYTAPGEDTGPATAPRHSPAAGQTPLPQTPPRGSSSLEAAGSSQSDAAIIVNAAGQAPGLRAAVAAPAACAAGPLNDSSLGLSTSSAALLPTVCVSNCIFAMLPDGSTGTDHAYGPGAAVAMAAAATAAAAARAAGNAAAAAAAARDLTAGATASSPSIASVVGASPNQNSTATSTVNTTTPSSRPGLHFKRPDIGFDCAPAASSPAAAPAAASGTGAGPAAASPAYRCGGGVAPNVLGLPPSPLLSEPWVQSPIAGACGGAVGRLEQSLQSHAYASYGDIAQQTASLFMACGSTSGGEFCTPTSEPAFAGATSAPNGGAAASAGRGGTGGGGGRPQLPSTALSSASAASCGTAGTALTTGMTTMYGGSTALGSSMIWSSSMYGTSPTALHALPFYQAGAAGALAAAAAAAATSSAAVSGSCHAPVASAAAPSTGPMRLPTQQAQLQSQQLQLQPQQAQSQSQPHTPQSQQPQAPQQQQQAPQRPQAPVAPPSARLYASAGPSFDRESSLPTPGAGPVANSSGSAAAAIMSNAAALGGPYGSSGSGAAAWAARTSPCVTPSPTPTHLGAAAANHYGGTAFSERLLPHRAGGRFGESPGNLFSVPEVNSGSCDGFNAATFGAVCNTRGANGSGGGDSSGGGGGALRTLAGVPPSPKHTPSAVQIHQMHVQMHMQMHMQHQQQQQVVMQHATMQQPSPPPQQYVPYPLYPPYPPPAFSPTHAGRGFPSNGFAVPAGSSPYASGSGSVGVGGTPAAAEPSNSESAAVAAAAALQQPQGSAAGAAGTGSGGGSGGGFGYRTLPGYNTNGAWSTVRRLPVPSQYLGGAGTAGGASSVGGSGGGAAAAAAAAAGVVSALPMPMHSVGSARRGSSGIMLQHVPEDDGDGTVGM